MTKISLVTEGGWPLPWLSYRVASFTLLSNPSAHAALWPGGLAFSSQMVPGHMELRAAEHHFLLLSVAFLGPLYH